MNAVTPETTLGEVYWDAYATADPAYGGRVPFAQLGEKHCAAIEAGAQAVAAKVLGSAAGEDAPGSEPAKVVIVTQATGQERRYNAPHFGQLADGTLVIGGRTGDDLDVIAAYAPGHWARVHKDGAALPGTIEEALDIAKHALERIAATHGSVVDTATLWKIAQDAVGAIFDLGFE